MNEDNYASEKDENHVCRAIIEFTNGKYCDEETRKWFNLEMLKADNHHFYTRIWGWYAKGGGACAPIYFDTITRNFYTMAILDDGDMMYKSGCNPDDLPYFIRKNPKPEPCPCVDEEDAERLDEMRKDILDEVVKDKPEPRPCEEDDRMDKRPKKYAEEADYFKDFKFAESVKDHWKLIPNIEFSRKVADFDEYISNRMSLLKDANKKTVIVDYFEQETMDLCIDGVRRQLEERFREWCNKLLE